MVYDHGDDYDCDNEHDEDEDDEDDDYKGLIVDLDEVVQHLQKEEDEIVVCRV